MNKKFQETEGERVQDTRAPVVTSKEDFGRRVYRAMLAKNMSQSDLARAISMDRNRVSRYVRGLSLPTARSLKKLADALNVKPGDLLPTGTSNDPAPLQTTISHDGSKMRIVTDVWVPLNVGAQVIVLLADYASPDRE